MSESLMFTGAIAAIAVTMALALVRALLGPSVYDRVLAVNMFGTKTVLLLAVAAFAMGRPDFVDQALAYALINFIGVLAVLQFFYAQGARRAAAEEAARSETNSAGDPS
jgi:multicomponent Na+:H+ antiporter subunit F